VVEDREKARRELEELTPVEAAQQAAVEQVGRKLKSFFLCVKKKNVCACFKIWVF
jgi:hypothetical protein